LHEHGLFGGEKAQAPAADDLEDGGLVQPGEKARLLQDLDQLSLQRARRVCAFWVRVCRPLTGTGKEQRFT
jgi:hypothetical protein